MAWRSPARNLIGAIGAYLESSAPGIEGVREVLRAMRAAPLSADHALGWEPRRPPPCAFLDDAMLDMSGERLGRLADAIEAARPGLHWRVDRGLFYAPGADVGAAYASGNAHCELIGPGTGVFHADDFRLGLFLLSPYTLYRDHRHRAPELYLTLSGPTGWRLEQGPWRERAAGELIWHRPHQSHATRVYERAFLSVYAWTRDVHERCRVAPAADWSEIEAGLRRRRR